MQVNPASDASVVDLFQEALDIIRLMVILSAAAEEDSAWGEDISINLDDSEEARE